MWVVTKPKLDVDSLRAQLLVSVFREALNDVQGAFIANIKFKSVYSGLFEPLVRPLAEVSFLARTIGLDWVIQALD